MDSAVLPTLASDVISKEDVDQVLGRGNKRRRIGFECASIDEALNGGLVYGEEGIYNISGAPGSNASETIWLQALVTHLVSNDSGPATVIDVSGTFDVLKLYSSIVGRLEKTCTNRHVEHAVMRERARQVLERVKIMRAFDSQGMMEGLMELNEELDQQSKAKDEAPKNTIGDSQEEEEDLDLVGTRQSNQKVDEETPKGRGFVVINNMSDVMSLALKNDYVQGQALMTDLLRLLRQAATKHELCVIVVSSSVVYKDEQETPSIFGSIRSRPGLGKTLGYLVDTQILLDMVPKSRSETSEWVNVLEVVSSRGMHQEGKFGVFGIGKDGELLDGI